LTLSSSGLVDYEHSFTEFHRAMPAFRKHVLRKPTL
jgi:hypothetical protein